VSIQVFFSYARDDDEIPPGKEDAKGFVTYLDEQLRYELSQLGQPRPRMWRDTRGIQRGDQFEPMIEREILASSIFAAVLSRNWVDRAWCRRELELFRKCWSGETDAQVKRRIVVVGRQPVPEADIPPLLLGQEGFRFYTTESGEPEQWDEYFVRGRIRDPRYEERVSELARFLWSSAVKLGSTQGSPQPQEKPVSRVAATQRRDGRIYLAKTAADMRLAYYRVADELARAGYQLIPPRECDIPQDAAAIEFVDTALSEADISVHLLGEKAGYSPEDATPIVKLQLERARARTLRENRAEDRSFHRILWVPPFVGDEQGAERDPLAVVRRFDSQLDSDTVVGDGLSRFTEFLMQHLHRILSDKHTTGGISAEDQVYVYHRPEDGDYALDVAVALRKRRMKALLPALEGDVAALEAFHRENLRQCRAVLLCWGQAPEIWARATARELRDWEKLGRSEKFAVRGLLAGPPPGSRKTAVIKLPPEDEIDVVLDLTTLSGPITDALDPLIFAAYPQAK
jgi:hypothetical protein